MIYWVSYIDNMIYWNVLKYIFKINNNRKILFLNKEEFVVDVLGLEVDEGCDYLW